MTFLPEYTHSSLCPEQTPCRGGSLFNNVVKHLESAQRADCVHVSTVHAARGRPAAHLLPVDVYEEVGEDRHGGRAGAPLQRGISAPLGLLSLQQDAGATDN